MFKIAGHTMGTPEYTVTEAITLFHRIGLEGIEIVVQDGFYSGLPTNAGEPLLNKIRRCAEENNIEIICLTPYFSKYNDLDNATRDADIAGIKNVIGYAKFLGAKFIRIYGGNYPQGAADPDGGKRHRLVSAMRLLGDEAQASGVKLVIENHFNTMAVSAAQTAELLNEINHPAVGALYDQVNLDFTYNEDYKTAIELQKKYIYYTHVKDMIFKSDQKAFSSADVSHPNDEERNVLTKIVGEGIMPWKEILGCLDKAGYEGWLSLEYERRWHPEDIPDASIGMKQSAEYLRTCFREK